MAESRLKVKKLDSEGRVMSKIRNNLVEGSSQNSLNC